jgi:hypothetical protein
MSRYPGTQFKVYDNSSTTAVVPVTRVNPGDAVTYLSTFASVKGPEGITLSYGDNFYNRYGTQDNIDFKKYGQPLFQTSMNVNNGAAILAKRAVLDDATLGNTTLAVVLTKYKEAIITPDGTNKSLISSITFDSNSDYKYSIAPLMFSIKNDKNYEFANATLNEHKDRYNLYKDYIIDVVANEDTPDNRFLSKLLATGENSGILSGFTQSVYYDDNDKVIDVNTEGKSNVRKVVSITTGISNGGQKTYSSLFDAKNDIIEDITAETVSQKPIHLTDVAYQNYSKKETSIPDYTIARYTIVKTGNGNDATYSGRWERVTGSCQIAGNIGRVTFGDISKINIDRFFTTLGELNDIVDESTWVSEDKYNTQQSVANPDDIGNAAFEWAVIQATVSVSSNEIIGINNAVEGDDIIDTTGYDNTIRLVNDLMTRASGYIISEWVFPMFTIFDNGRGESIKTIGLEYDSASSITMKKAIYRLNVYNYDISTSKKLKRLETYSFSLNPYVRNDSTGYTFDIESVVNYNSAQISVKTYYEAYDALLETLQLILGSNDNDLIGTYDILFGHSLNGKYAAYNSYNVSTLLKRSTSIFDYAHLDIFDNDVITVNAYCDWDNMTSTDKDMKTKGYYYNWNRTNNNILERLEFGSNGYVLDRKTDNSATVVPFIVIDAEWDNKPDADGLYYDSMEEIMKITGQKNGAIISSETLDITDVPVVPENFKKVNITMVSGTLYKYSATEVSGHHYTTTSCYVVNSDKALSSGRVFQGNSAATSAATVAEIGEGSWAIAIEEADKNTYTKQEIYIPYTEEKIYQNHYYRFFAGEFDKDIFNLDIYFPNAVFDANYDNEVKLAIQRLAAYRGDFMCYMDMGINKVKSFEDCNDLIPSTLGGLDLTAETSEYFYVRDMHVAVTCLYYKIRNPYDNRVIQVTGTYGLSNLYIAHFMNNVGDVFAGISNGITIGNIIEGTVNYIPKIYPTSEMTSLNNIGGVYPSDDSTIVNEKQLMCDLKVNYGCYYDDRFSIETEYTMNPTESEFSYWNNVALVCMMMQSIRKACPAARYQFITADDLTVYKDAVETAMKPWKNKFASIKFKYVQDDAALENKIFHAAIEVVFRPFAQAEIFELTALNYSTLSSSVTSV